MDVDVDDARELRVFPALLVLLVLVVVIEGS